MRKEVFLILLVLLPIALADNSVDDTHYLITDSKHMKVFEVNQNGTFIWDHTCTGSSCSCSKNLCFYGFDSATRLDNGNTLLIDNVYNKIVEIDIDGNTAWRYGDGTVGSYFNQLNHPSTAFRLANGNTLIADSGNNRVIEVGKERATMWEYGCSNKNIDCSSNTLYENLKNPSSATMTRFGTVLIADTDNDRVIEVDKNNEIVWSMGCVIEEGTKSCPTGEKSLFKPMFAVRLENTTLITDSGNHRIIEVDNLGKPVWQYGVGKGNGYNQLNYPKSAIKLKNGNILIADSGNNRVIEVNKQTKDLAFEYVNLNTPSYVEVAKVNYDRVRTSAPGCSQKERGFSVEYSTNILPKYNYVVKNGTDKKIYLIGKYENGLFTSNDERITESGQYTFFAAYDGLDINYSMYCKLDKLICNAINLSIDDCYVQDGILNVSFTGLKEQYKFIQFKNMFVDLTSDEKIWDETGSRKCGEKPLLDLSRFGLGSTVSKVGPDRYEFVAPIGKYNVKMGTLMLGECCQEDVSGILIYPKTKSNMQCRVITKCKDDIECDDGNKYTTDICEEGICKNQRKNIDCMSDSDCNDYNKCTGDTCVGGKCSNQNACIGCNYCASSRQGCISNETCIASLEATTQPVASLAPLEKFEEKSMSNLFIFMFVIVGILISAASSGAVFIFMKKRLDAEIEKEKKLEVENKNGSVVRNLSPEQAKGIQEIIKPAEPKPTIAADAKPFQPASPAAASTAEPAKKDIKEEEAKHVRQAFPGTVLPVGAKPKVDEPAQKAISTDAKPTSTDVSNIKKENVETVKTDEAKTASTSTNAQSQAKEAAKPIETPIQPDPKVDVKPESPVQPAMPEPEKKQEEKKA